MCISIDIDQLLNIFCVQQGKDYIGQEVVYCNVWDLLVLVIDTSFLCPYFMQENLIQLGQIKNKCFG